MSNVDVKNMIASARDAFQIISSKDEDSMCWWNNSLCSFFRSNGKIDKPFRKSFDKALNPLVEKTIRTLEKAKAGQDVQSINEKISSLIENLNFLRGKASVYYFDEDPKFTEDINTIGDLFTELEEELQNTVSQLSQIVPIPSKNKNTHSYKYDAFISHASEDKEDAVEPLVEACKKLGITVWYDKESMDWSSNLADEINRGIAESRYVIVFISSKYLEKYWTKAEYGGAVAREPQGGKVILPIWHEIDPEEIKKRYPILADKRALDFSIGVDEIAEKLRSMLAEP